MKNAHRELHGALLDAEILADVYLLMTGGQTDLLLAGQDNASQSAAGEIRRLSGERPRLRVVQASETETAAHEVRLQGISQSNGGVCLWQQEKK